MTLEKEFVFEVMQFAKDAVDERYWKIKEKVDYCRVDGTQPILGEYPAEPTLKDTLRETQAILKFLSKVCSEDQTETETE